MPKHKRLNIPLFRSSGSTSHYELSMKGQGKEIKGKSNVKKTKYQKACARGHVMVTTFHMTVMTQQSRDVALLNYLY